ncbi:MAG TPA: IS66 family transposase [Gemmataceae bacterium]|nr:IS66 family transposase [Gemmataceae bacterium]
MSTPNPAPVALPLTAEQLPDDPELLKSMILELLACLQQQQRDKEALEHRLSLLLQRLYGPRGERFDPNQSLLFGDPQATTDPGAAAPAESTEPAKPKRKCRPHGRRRLPENLPRETRHHELTVAERICPGCGQQRQEIGMDKSEQLDYKPASLFVIEHIVHKYACPCCSRARQQASPGLPAAQAVPREEPEPMTTPTESSLDPASSEPTAQTSDITASAGKPPEVVTAASKPALPIARGLPGPGLLAHLIVSKYVDHLPLHRLESIYERQGLFLPRSTLCDWLLACGRLLRPLYDRLVYWTLLSRALHTDDTPVKLQDPKTHQLSTARMWVYTGDTAHPYNVFDFTPNRKRDGPVQFLQSYQGYLHADAFSGYDCLYLPDPRTSTARILEVACNAHARRKFYEARGSDLLRSHQALGYYRMLYELERQAKDFSETQKLQMRQDLAMPILNQFKAWIDKERPEVLPKSPMAEALGYAFNNWTGLVRYTAAGFLDIDNNVAEREMKRVAIGRKNWLFVGSQAGGQMAAVMLSFTSTCNRLKVEPWSYLQDVLSRMPELGPGQLDELLPDRWQAARQAGNPSAENA